MSFSSPVFLLSLLPWLALSLWLLWGRRRRVRVPFVDLWKIPQRLERPPRSLEPPPLYVALILLALLLCILAAAGPTFRSAVRTGELTIVVDRSPLLSKLRYDALIDSAAAAVVESLPAASIRLVLVPGPTLVTDASDWPALAKAQPPTSRPTADTLLATLSSTPGPLILISDQALPPDPRIFQITSDAPPTNVSITHVAARLTPTPELMLTLRNDSPRPSATLRIDATTHALSLPPQGQSRDYFLPLPPARRVDLSLADADDIPIDNRATLTRRPTHPRPEPRAPLPASVQRLIDDHKRLRPPDDASTTIAIVTSLAGLPVNEPAIALLRGPLDISPAGYTIADHPIARSVVAWPRATAVIADASATPIVRSPAGPVVALRGGPTPQLLVALDLDAWAHTPDFVIFFSNAFTALAPSSEAFTADIVTLPPRAGPTDWRSQLRDLSMPPSTRPTSLARILLLAAAALTLLSLLTWRTSDRTD